MDDIAKLVKEFKQEVREQAIDEFAEKLCDEVEYFTREIDGLKADLLTLDYFAELVLEIAEQLKGGKK